MPRSVVHLNQNALSILFVVYEHVHLPGNPSQYRMLNRPQNLRCLKCHSSSNLNVSGLGVKSEASPCPYPATSWHGPVLKNRPPLVLLVPALAVGAALLLPPVYLAIRALGAGRGIVGFAVPGKGCGHPRPNAAAGCNGERRIGGISGPLLPGSRRVLTLPWRRAWAVITFLPLVIPSYVAGFIVVVALGPKGMLQGALEGPFGVDRLPSIYGLPGAFLTLTLLSYPYVLITVRAALQRMDPALEETARGLGLGPVATFFRVVVPLLRPSIGAGALLVGLYMLSDFGVVSLLRYETFTWAIFIQYDSRP